MRTFRDVIEYIELKVEFLKTKAQRDFLNVLSYAAVRLLIVLFMSMFLLMFSVALGFMIGYWIGEPFAGFLVVSVFYLTVGLGLVFFRKKLSSYLFQKIFQSNLEIFKLDPTTYSLEETIPDESDDFVDGESKRLKIKD